ncbi:methylmalonyl Co-A mutase-associated GTPase MeaB [Nocardioides sp. ChNu-153]|uniref:methylmalonyl Co-A mutase-associated GTPase MeaB n=1 Tax=Nocardioides sp. ChNu-153 TaxID=2779364 RepID=UPI00265147E2|nr:methylmalonyl Co-A mutase-associated GTPase MeaB [Nocardioides sp. ChNu-153]MDN7120669.1 methylmalonyl Co-A mutase-associated GTPase MeaB [Nocardioides sp. ChNu-153]
MSEAPPRTAATPARGRRRTASVPDLVAAARGGDPRAVGRLVSLVEDAGGAPRADGEDARAARLREAMALLAPHTGHAHVVGVTGSPGVGKSTSTNALVTELRARGRRVGVLAVDPSSPFSGGALLGDRIRMGDHATDADVYIRSMASRGHLGGLSWSTPQALRVLDAAGFDVVLVETVGVGQSEVEVAGLADTTVVLLAPGMGDGIQAAKAGILEVGDLYVVNKADRGGADQVRRELRGMLNLADRPADAWRPPILATTAQSGEGVSEVVDRLEEHRAWLATTGHLAVRRRRRAREEVEAIALTHLRRTWAGIAGGGRGSGGPDLDVLADDVVAGRRDPYGAADALLAATDGVGGTPTDG